MFVSGDNMPPAGMTSLLAGPAWCPCSWFCGTAEVMCQPFTCPWVGFSPRLPLLQRSGDHDDRKHKGGNTHPNYKKEPAAPSEHHPHSGRIMGDLSLPLVMPPGTVLWPLKTVTTRTFPPAELAVFLFCRIGDRPRVLCHPGGCGTDHITAPHRERNRNGDTSTPLTITLCGLP